MVYALLIAAGLFGGFLAGLLGVGGGVIFVFVLSFYFEDLSIEAAELPRYLISNSIFATFFAGLSSSIKNNKLKSFYWKEVLSCAIPGVLSALVMTFFITQYDWYDKKKFTIIFVVLLLFFLAKTLKNRKSISFKEEASVPTYKLAITGVLSGLVSALSGLGGGVIMIPLLSQVLGIRMQKAASISLGVIPFLALSMTIFYGISFDSKLEIANSIGYLVFPAALPLALGVIVAAPIGIKVARTLSTRVIKVMFATLLAIVALKMIIGYFN